MTTLTEVVSGVCTENGRTPPEMADRVLSLVADNEAALKELQRLGAKTRVGEWLHKQRSTAVRSGHQNGSGRLASVEADPATALLSMPVLIGGVVYAYGKLDGELNSALIAERRKQLAEDARWVEFFEQVEERRRKAKAKTNGDIGEALEEIREAVFGNE